MKVVLIGTFRKNPEKLKDIFTELSENFDLLSPKSVDFVDVSKEFVRHESELSTSSRDIQTKVLRCIDNADFVWLFAPQGYVGVSGAFEIGYCNALRKQVFTDEAIADEMLSTMVHEVKSPLDVKDMLDIAYVE